MVSKVRKSGARDLTYALIVSCFAMTNWVGEVRSAGAPKILRISTASKAGTFYPIGSLIAKGLSDARKTGNCAAPEHCGVPNLLAVAQISNGSVANVEAISAGRIEAALAQADVVYWAHSGSGRFESKGPLRGIRVIANLYPGSLHIVGSAASRLKRVRDLIGQRVALDEPGSGTLASAEMILASEKIRKSDITALYIKHIHAGPMLAQGKLDAFFFVAGFPTKSVIDVSRRLPVRLIPLSDRTIQSLVADRPYFARGVIPGGTYAGVEADVPTVDIGTQLIVREDLDPELVYQITAQLWSKRTRVLLDKGHPKGEQVRLETALKGVGVPLHNGAARYYREAGVLKQ
ncbi:MAG: TAXI family TRAP transporter solute-binding subunit [Hyphomicrobiaceae bacterium]